ncbi:glucan 1,3-beta-glucosidase [Phlyctema vagabunda]|uniref:Probable glucan endo-1,3-beta-glucosidase eglC n=1 Tax=Phlyctema vagabunda TaxID=108571 RepID=A0ABR4PMX9_9HELO
MKTASYALALAATLSGADAYWKGFNIAATRAADGACKTQADWEKDFTTMAALPGGFTSARLYASSDCNTLQNAVPAAKNTGTTLLVGVWTEDAAHYDAEKQALLSAVQTHGFDWIVSVSVGSEDLYRGDTDANTLAQQIYDVRGMLSTVPGYTTNVNVGHVDTWTAWVDPANVAVIKACDFVGTDAYPYFQNTEANGIDVAGDLFFDSLQRVRDTVQNAGSGAWVWITETGWPVTGATENQAVANVANAKQFWDVVGCAAFQQAHTFMYVLQDYNVSPSFGVLDANFNSIYDLTC